MKGFHWIWTGSAHAPATSTVVDSDMELGGGNKGFLRVPGFPWTNYLH